MVLQGISFAPGPKGVQDATRPKGIKYPARLSRSTLGESQDPCTVLQERSVQKGVQCAARPKGIHYATRLKGVQYLVGSSRGMWGERVPDGCQVLQMGWGTAVGGNGGSWQRSCGAEPGCAARP